MSGLTERIEQELRAVFGKWILTERLLFEEIDRLRAELKEEQDARISFLLQYGNQLNALIED